MTIFNSGDVVLGGATADAQFAECFEAKDAWVAIQSPRLKDIASLAQCLGLQAGDAHAIHRWMRERTASEVISQLEGLGIFGARVPRSDQLLDCYLLDGGRFAAQSAASWSGVVLSGVTATKRASCRMRRRLDSTRGKSSESCCQCLTMR